MAVGRPPRCAAATSFSVKFLPAAASTTRHHHAYSSVRQMSQRHYADFKGLATCTQCAAHYSGCCSTALLAPQPQQPTVEHSKAFAAATASAAAAAHAAALRQWHCCCCCCWLHMLTQCVSVGEAPHVHVHLSLQVKHQREAVTRVAIQEGSTTCSRHTQSTTQLPVAVARTTCPLS
jgi:hypothetical protein